MADTLSISTAGGLEVPLDNTLRESLTYLNILCANEFENEPVEQGGLKIEYDFYKGTPPTWLNFYLAEKTKSDSSHPEEDRQPVVLMKRDGYERLRELIKGKQGGGWSVNLVRLIHEPGSGGSTLAMQILWDLRKELRCAILLDPNFDKKDASKQTQKDILFEPKMIAQQVIELFRAGGPGNQNTVLLLQDNERMRDPLQDCLIREMNEQRLNAECPVVIILQCARVKCITDDEDDEEGIQAVTLRTSLSETEKQHLAAQELYMKRSYGKDQRRLHSFNIMLHNFGDEYIRKYLDSNEGEEIMSYTKRNKMSLSTKLLAFMALLNSYVPGSYLLLSECEAFLSRSFEDTMLPFKDLIVMFTRAGGSDKCVRMAHASIAQQCVKMLADAGVTRSTAALEFLQHFSRKQIQTSLLQFFRDMLTKRERTSEGQNKFSMLIMEIQENEDRPQCINVLKAASDTFRHDPIYPQALARFYYSRIYDFTRAEVWAEKAKEKMPTNSFIADTLGQVHKYHLNSTFKTAGARDILFLAEKAIKAFKQEEELAEREPLIYMEDASPTRMAYFYNNRGLFGFLQVASIVYDSLTNKNPTWGKVLRQEISAEDIPALSEDRKLLKYKVLISSLKTEVEKKFYGFFEGYLTYSEPTNWRDQPPYFKREITDCFLKYTNVCSPRDSKQELKKMRADTFPGLLSFLNQDTKASDLDAVASLWHGIHEANPANVSVACNYILAKILLSKGSAASQGKSTLAELRAILQRFMDTETPVLRTPEFYLLVLLLFWPEEKTGQAPDSIDLNMNIESLRLAFEMRYKKYFYFRELVPLFYLGKGNGLKRLVHKSKIDVICEQLKQKSNKLREKGGVGDILKNTNIRDLTRIHGVVRDRKAYVCVTGKEIEVIAHKPASVWKNGPISFFLGFNISGPVAFDISYKRTQTVDPTVTEQRKIVEGLGIPHCCIACDHVKESSFWTKIQPSVTIENGIPVHRHVTPKGRYECKASGLRWVCEKKVQLKYSYSCWEPYCSFLGAMQYTQGGPLMDISMEMGKLEEVHLPHFACLGSDVPFQDGMRILHVEESGVSVEKVHEVTRFHVKLLQPTFSPKGVLLRSGIPLKVHCDLMVYLSRTKHLSLRLYFFPSVPALVEAVEKYERPFGFMKMAVPRPEKSLKTMSWFKLRTTCPAKIEPEKIKLRYSNTTPSFFKILVDDCNAEFEMELISGVEKVWKAGIYQDEVRDMISSRAKPPPDILPAGFVKENRAKLIQTITNVLPIADILLSKDMIHAEEYNKIKKEKVPQDQMRIIIGSVISKGPTVEAAFFKALRDECQHELDLVLADD